MPKIVQKALFQSTGDAPRQSHVWLAADGERTPAARRRWYRQGADYLGLNPRWEGGLMGHHRGRVVHISDQPLRIDVDSALIPGKRRLDQCFWLLEAGHDAYQEYLLEAIPQRSRPVRVEGLCAELHGRYAVWSRPADFAACVFERDEGLILRLARSMFRRIDVNWLFSGVSCHAGCDMMDVPWSSIARALALSVDLVVAVEMCA
jgi:hypothetical protein